MFSGIVAAVGHIESLTPLGADADSGVRLRVHAGGMPLDDVALGDSIAIQGACMTVIACHPEHQATVFEVDVSRESLDKTVGLAAPGPVNLEKALRLADRIGGHLVSGHVDGVGEVVQWHAVGESQCLGVRVARELGRFLAYKGSVVINGVSLTVNTVSDTNDHTDITINLIPHTQEVTTLRHLQLGARVNVEIDLLARYCERLLSERA